MNDKPLFHTLIPALLVACLAAGAPASARDSDIDRCAELESDAERLACFDAAIRQRAESTAPPAGPPDAPAATTSAPAPDVPASAAPAPAAPAAAAPAAAAPAATGGTVNTEYRFMTKEEKRAARRAQKEQEKAQREYTAVVTAIRTRPHGQVAVTLDNGEEWSEQYASRSFLVKVGDTVTLKKSRFSSAYRLVNEDGRGYPVTRLR